MICGVWAFLILCAALLFGAPPSASANASVACMLSQVERRAPALAPAAYVAHAADVRPEPRTDVADASDVPPGPPVAARPLPHLAVTRPIDDGCAHTDGSPYRPRSRAPPAASR